MNTCLRGEGMQVGYRSQRRSHTVLRDLDLELKAGEVTVLLGRNGAGKSTLMRTLAGVQPLLGGKLELQGRPIQECSPLHIARQLAWVTPLREIAPGLTGWDLVALGRQPHTSWHGRLTSHDQQVMEQAMDACGSRELALRSLSELSDGERQRLLLARALAQETAILLLDEPTAFLDRPGRHLVFKLAKEWAASHNRCLLISTHDLDLALQFGDQAILVHEGQGFQAGCGNPTMLAAIEKAFAI
jgi:iron complex transport system ATP-binding protein